MAANPGVPAPTLKLDTERTPTELLRIIRLDKLFGVSDESSHNER